MTYVVTNDRGRPVAVSPTIASAMEFARQNTDEVPASDAVTWSQTGKMLVGTRWTGWEIKEVEVVI